MKRTRKPNSCTNKGYALLITIVFIGISLLLLGSVMDWTNSTAKQTERNNLYSSALAAAEAADETVLAYVRRDFFGQTYNSVPSYEAKLPDQNAWHWPVPFLFSNSVDHVANQTYLGFGNGTHVNNFPPAVWAELGYQYQGLGAWVIPCTVISTATALNQTYPVAATVKEQFQLASIPVFQFAIFYNMDLEISPGADMTVNGKTFVNGNIWASPSGDLTFGDTVQATGDYYHTRAPFDPQSDGSGTVAFLANNSQGLYAPDTDVEPLTMPVGTNSFQTGATNSASSVAAILDLPPSGVDPNSPAGQTYLYNQADIIISNSASGTLSAFYQNSNNVNQLTPIPYDVTNAVSHATYYSFVTNVSFYDYRESDTVKAVQLDVGKFSTWLSGRGATYNNQNNSDSSTGKGHAINSVYIYNSATFSSSQLPAIRVSNGATLPSQGLTVATPFPIYVLGNYNASASDLGKTNVADTAPASFLGDAVTILSTSWKDSYTSSTALNKRNASSTTVNAAMLEGIVETTNIGGRGTSGDRYSGGVENFLRLLENWSGDTLTYNGSIVVMFDSRYATNYWQSPGVYYGIPTRQWGFNVNFHNQNQLPPLTPQTKALVRNGWSAY